MVRPIETTYKDCCFRSRLEARWAVFFDVLRIEWAYEPESFDFGCGLRYVPDFRISHRYGDLWCEVKPALGQITQEEWLKIVSLAKKVGPDQLILLDGEPSRRMYPTIWNLFGLDASELAPPFTPAADAFRYKRTGCALLPDGYDPSVGAHAEFFGVSYNQDLVREIEHAVIVAQSYRFDRRGV